jgi:hypothetical protein
MLTRICGIRGVRRGLSTAGSALFLGVLLSAPRTARADVASCTQLHASAQREAKDGRPKRASELFASCGATEGCPEKIRAECVELYEQVEKTVPTVVFTVTDEQGRDITNVQVYSTDTLVAQALDGRPVSLDPGKHRFRFVLPWGEVLSSDVLIREGEKNRVVGVQVKDRAAASPKPADAEPVAPVVPAPAAPPLTTPRVVERALPVGFWVASGIGAAALTSWGIFGLLGRSNQSAVDECTPNCGLSERDDYDNMKSNYLIADVSLGVAALSAGVATWLFLSADGGEASSTQQGKITRTPRFAVLPLQGGSGAALIMNGTSF